MNRFGIYIHIPFCKQKCKYCDFVSFCCDENMQNKYMETLIKEIKEKKLSDFNFVEFNRGELEIDDSHRKMHFEKQEDSQDEMNTLYEEKRKVTTIYIGGGTPSFIDSKWIVQVLDTIKEKFIVAEEAEITIEINPGTATKEKMIDYKNAGVNRISIGLQSTEDRILNLIGRIHTYAEFLKTYEIAKEVGFDNINVDLILAIPTQTEKELQDSVIKVINLEPKHISLYSLILEDGTELEKLVSEGKLGLIDEKIERKMYWKTKKLLQKNGYNHYEISNFSKKGYESKHNTDCWNQEEYIGYGLAAHSYVNGKRVSNTDCLDTYIQNIENNELEKNRIVHEEQTREEKAKEYMLLGLRKIEGISISSFERKFRINPLFYFCFEIEKLVKENLIEVDLDYIKLTEKGLDFANIVFEEFV